MSSASVVRFKPLYGCLSEDPLCFLLEIDETRILLDCGWTEAFDTALLEPLARVARTVDYVLLSHPDLAHLGAYPFAVGKLGLACPALATLPVHNLGQMTMYDVHQSRTDVEDFGLFTLDDIDVAFEKITLLRYSQNFPLSGKGSGISITAMPAGHTIGGTVWRIKKDSDEIIYAVDYNDKKERHLNGTLLDTISRPSLLITDAMNAGCVQTKRKQRDEDLFETILATLRRNGNVLLPVDSAARVLELAYLLGQNWSFPYPIAFLSHQSYRTLEYTKSMLEWMGEDITKQFDRNRENPFDFKHVRLCHTIKEIEKLPSPKVVLATTESLTTGFALQLFVNWANDPRNSVIFTQRGCRASLARTLIVDPSSRSIPIQFRRRVPLEGEELTRALAERERKAREAAAMRPTLGRRRSSGRASISGRGSSGSLASDAVTAGSQASSGRSQGSKAIVDGVNMDGMEGDGDNDDDRDDDDGDDDDDDDGDVDGDDGEAEEKQPDGAAGGLVASGNKEAHHSHARKRSRGPEDGESARRQRKVIGSSDDADDDWDADGDLAGKSFDAYVREGTKSGGFFKQNQKFRMFPFVEKRPKCDSYGEVIHLEDYTRLDFGGEMQQRQEEAKALDASKQDKVSVDGKVAPSETSEPQILTKFVVEDIAVDVKCTVKFIDFEGLADGRSIKKIISEMMPKKIILVHGDIDSTRHLQQFVMQSSSLTNDVSAPACGDVIEASSSTNIFAMKLTDAIVSSLQFSKVGDYELAFVSGVLRVNPDQPLAILDVSPQSETNNAHNPVMIGDITLSEFRKVLQRESISTELTGGILVCNNMVSIRKVASGRLVMEGAVCEDYYKIRSLLYSFHAIV